tara:strand:+ start:1159 stop:1425 length:267 start_codon:yes stop_codon:yes gene_type:complete
MKSNKYHSGKYVGWVWFSWLIFVVTAIASAVLINQSGVLEMPSGIGLTPSAFSTIAICVGQTIGALLIAGAFTIANGIYEASIEPRPD